MQNICSNLSRHSPCIRRLSLIARHLRSESMSSINPTTNGTSTDDEYTAGLIIIGDEILKGQCADTNSCFITRHLFSWGVKVKKISVIPDDLDIIAREVSEFSSKYKYVITSGGVGPTHDDLTFEGVARAVDEPVIPHPQLVELCKKYFGTDDLNSPKLKMAKVAKSAKLIYGEDKTTGEKTKYPLVNVRNIYMFPGVPSITEKAFPLLKDLLKNPNVEWYTRELYVQLDEITITPILNDVDDKFKHQVTLGSYPDFINSYYKVKLTLESENKETIEEAYRSLHDNLPPDSIVQYDKNPILNAVTQLYGIVERSDSSEFTQKVKHSVSVLEQCFQTYSLDEVCVGFNGGKDCTVLVHLVHAVMRKNFPDNGTKAKALYIRSKLPFPEVEKFIQISRDRYKMEMLNFNGRIKDSLSDLREQQPGIKAVIMGTRETDPYSSHLEPFTMTDPDWPQFMRVSPLLNWTYSDIWQFLRSLCIPYCSLYDRGYTSLGCMNNTHPNPSLQYLDENEVVRYKPAYQLTEDSKERDGRNT